MDEQKFLEALKKLRESNKERKFDQTIDLILNLKEFDLRKNALNIFIQLPHKIKDKKIAGFFEKDSSVIKTIRKNDFGKYKEKKDMRRLVKEYDFFIANAKLMPAIATSFGRVLGPFGKMPSPQLGILLNEDENMIKALVKKINSTVRIRMKEPSIKIGIGKESLKDEQILQNIMTSYNKILENLPKGKDNLRNVKIKLTMSKPVLVK